MHSSLKQRSRISAFTLTIFLLFGAATAIMKKDSPDQAVRTSAESISFHTLVIDAGHGGLDGGAVSVNGEKESDINLSVASALFDLCRFLGVKSSMTRSGSELAYPEEAGSVREKKIWDLKRRAAQINETDGAVLLSIHQNLYPDPRPSGTQVLYAASKGSEELAVLTHGNLISALCPENRRLALPAQNKIYLLNNVKCPAILVECGFLSNPEEANKLVSPAYQRALAVILCASYLQFCNSY